MTCMRDQKPGEPLPLASPSSDKREASGESPSKASRAGLVWFRWGWTVFMVVATSAPYLLNWLSTPEGFCYTWILPPYPGRFKQSMEQSPLVWRSILKEAEKVFENRAVAIYKRKHG